MVFRFSLSEAARLAGVSVGAPYRHFADKEALFSEVAGQGFVELCERIEAAAKTSADDPRKRPVAIGMAYVRFAVERPSHFQAMFDSAIHRRKDPAVEPPFKYWRRQFMTLPQKRESEVKKL